jgi:hypothetical protein
VLCLTLGAPLRRLPHYYPALMLLSYLADRCLSRGVRLASRCIAVMIEICSWNLRFARVNISAADANHQEAISSQRFHLCQPRQTSLPCP